VSRGADEKTARDRIVQLVGAGLGEVRADRSRMSLLTLLVIGMRIELEIVK
jgi:hypothetical protein